jgi:hypothetical protein
LVAFIVLYHRDNVYMMCVGAAIVEAGGLIGNAAKYKKYDSCKKLHANNDGHGELQLSAVGTDVVQFVLLINN